MSKADLQNQLADQARLIAKLQSQTPAPPATSVPDVQPNVISQNIPEVKCTPSPAVPSPAYVTGNVTVEERYKVFSSLRTELNRTRRAQELEEENVVLRFAMFNGGN